MTIVSNILRVTLLLKEHSVTNNYENHKWRSEQENEAGKKATYV